MSYATLQKILALVPLESNGPEVYVATMTTVLSNSYDSLNETFKRLKILNLKFHPGENEKYCCAEILADYECLVSTGAFKPDQLGYITCIFEYTFDSRFHIWAKKRGKEVMECIKELCVYNEDFMQPDDIITYESLFQEAM